MKVAIKGLIPCGIRKVDLQQYRDFFESNGHEVVEDPAESDVILLWTCAFRGDFRDNSIAEIKRHQREFRAELIVAGCLPDIDGELLRQHFRGRVIAWREDEQKLEEYFGGGGATFRQIRRAVAEDKVCDDAAVFRALNPDKDAWFGDQFVKLFVAEGCRFQCTYCAERLAFPPYRSVPEDALVEACRRVVEKTGQHDVMLLADSLGDYGHDIGSSLPRLIRKLRGADPALQIALHGLNPADFVRHYADMVEFIRKGDIRHLQLPIQSASDRILRLMRRPYRRTHLEKIFGFLKEVGFKEFETHILVAFPGEREEDHEATVDFVLRFRPRYVLASGFMETPAMPAAKLPDKVDGDTRRRRLTDVETRLRAAGIICNTDESALSVDRFHRLNLVAGCLRGSGGFQYDGGVRPDPTLP